MTVLPTEIPLIELGEALSALDAVNPLRISGRVTEVTGLVVRATVPGIKMGEMVIIESTPRLRAEVVGFRGDEVVLMPLGDLAGVGPDNLVSPMGRPLGINMGWGTLGRVLDGLGEPIDGGGPIRGETEDWAVDRAAPDPLKRRRVEHPLHMGVRAIDALLTVGEGQRVGFFAGSGVGKSTLMGQIARNCSADVNVICLVGERGREVVEFIEDSLGDEGRKRSVVVCATSDVPSLVRLKSCFVATAVAEWFRDQGKKVLLMMDSCTRFARAQREVGLAAGEPPARQGYPPSVFAMLPRLLERSGNSDRGSITALYTVLVSGGDMEEPIADEVRGILDGHIILSRELGARNHWPAIDVLPSLSRVMPQVTTPEHRKAAGKMRELMATYEKQRDLILLGAYQAGSDPRTDEAVAKIDNINTFLKQGTHENSPFPDTIRKLQGIV